MGKKNRKKRSSKTGLSPGSIVHIGEQISDKIEIELLQYNSEDYTQIDFTSIDDAINKFDPVSVNWLNINGLHDTDIIKNLGETLKINQLIIEDILNTEQRPKIEIDDNYVFVVMKVITSDVETLELNLEQISFLLSDNYVVTFQEKKGDIFNLLRERIREKKGKIRFSGTDYLLYALMDIVVDYYFVCLENIGDELELIEEMLIVSPEKTQINKIHQIKRQINNFRHSVWPTREIINRLVRGDSDIIKGTTEIFLRDLYDHIINVSENLESYRDTASGLAELYLTNISNRMNEIMKVLTIIATIFIPLSFFAGVYGMNFEIMPELKWEWGYYGFWTLIIILSATMLTYFRKKKWL